MIRLQFVLGQGISSQAIAWFSAGHFSHVDVVMPEGKLLGARSDECGGQPPGVRVRPPFYEEWKERVVMSLMTTQDKEAAFYGFLRQQIGKPYDSTAIWGFVAGRDWRDDTKWFCSELAAGGMEEAGILPTLYTPRNKITPSALATVISAKGGVWT